MVTNDATIIKVKHETLYEVAKAAYEGNLEEEKDQIPFRMIPGPKAKYRCCIYKEREVIRQRIRLACGKHMGEKDNGLVVQVIEAACEGCPISRYVVTDNCQNCMGKACISSCRFGAISAGKNRTHIDPDKCKECGMCAKACPYNAIADLIRPCKRNCPVDAITMDENNICKIDPAKCIECGKCIHSCPFGAIMSRTFIVDVIRDIVAGKRVVAMLAPSTEGQFGPDITMQSWRTALKKIGFADMVEVGLGGDLTAHAEAKEWAEAYAEGKKMTTSCCPAFYNLVRNFFPDQVALMSSTVSPMVAVSRMLKAEDPDTITVFIGPCIAKKSEVLKGRMDGNADYALTYGEIRAMLKARGVKLEPEANINQQASVYGKRFGNGGGVANAVLESMKEMGVDTSKMTVHICDGAEECKKAMLLLKAGRLPEDFIEGMACQGGCVGGPSRHTEIVQAKKARDLLIAQADGRNIEENLHSYNLDSFSMTKDRRPPESKPAEEE
jgi:ferredoxin hydrogenase large subunit